MDCALELFGEKLPPALAPYLTGARLTPSALGDNGGAMRLCTDACSYYLKIAPRGTLANEAAMTAAFHAKGLAARVCEYCSADRDYLLTEELPGKPACDSEFLAQPRRLSEMLGQILRMLHESQKEENGDVLIHGDYCLPNILLHDDFTLSGFVDLGGAGLGDRHCDLYWGVESLQYNLRSNAYRDHFLDAYGRELVDMAALRA